jgi:hypothetical protein
MRVLRHLGPVLVAACIVGSTGVSSALAEPVFLFHPTGKLLAKAGGFQILETTRVVICTGASLVSTTTTLLSTKAFLATVKYEKCVGTSVGLFKYLIHSDGLADLEATVVMLATECKVTLPSAKNQRLGTILFDNTASGSLLLLLNLGRVVSFGQGAECELPEANGTIVGDIGVSREGGGAVRWDA